MKKIMSLIVVCLFLLVGGVLANVSVSSANSDMAILAFSGISSPDVRFEDVQLVVETNSLSDRFVADYSLDIEGGVIYLSVDLSDIYVDYSLDEIRSIIISGTVDGEYFAKRIALREGNNVRFGAPLKSPSTSSLVYFVVGLVLVIVILALLVLLAHDSKHSRKQRSSKKKSSKKKSKKKVTKKKKSKKR